jgi:prepilin-type processing-associated H-X9-DG protein
VLIGLLLPGVQSARESARRAQCTNNLKQIGLAVNNYHAAFETMPAGGDYARHIKPTWAAAILPFLEQQNVYAQFDFEVDVSHEKNEVAVSTIIPGYMCPSDPVDSPLLGGRIQKGSNNTKVPSMGLWYPSSMGPTRDGVNPNDSCVFCPEPPNQVDGSYCCADTSNYGCCQRISKKYPGKVVPGVGAMDRSPVSVEFALVKDGLSNTFLAGETLPSQCSFNGAYNHNHPINGTTIPLNTFEDNSRQPFGKWYTACGFKSRHPGGANFVMCDGSVHYLSDSIDYRTYNLLGNRKDRETVRIPN